MELLCQSSMWFLDGTFKMAPNIFTQIFTILSLRQRAGRPDEMTSFPFIYTLLTSKKKEEYVEVLRAVRDATAQFNITHCNPDRIMSDFELSIIQACPVVYPQVPIAACFFHLGQSVYRQIQQRGLQVAYNGPKCNVLYFRKRHTFGKENIWKNKHSEKCFQKKKYSGK